MNAAHRRTAFRVAAWLAVLAALALVFAAYLDPHLMAELANRLWACF
jgi:hypothetical protein